ncbi:MAG: P-loop NTPase fold protein, partial [Terriglobia bacterium]
DQALTVAETYLGLDGIEGLKKTGERTVGDVKGVVDDVRVTAARTRSAWDWLLRAPVDARQLGRWAAAMLVILAIGIAASGWAKMAWPAFYGIAINATGVVVLGVGWARRHLTTISKGLDQFDEIRRRIALKIESERSKTQTELAQAQVQHEAALKKVVDAADRLKDAQAAIEKAERDVRDSRSISRIAKLLEERIAGKSYERYLGIVAAVRMDFQRLSDLMKAMRTDVGAGAAVADAGALRSVDRIVLYIDDLDRCPADKVVAVLEAIHLLLAFELFVVVVGVDIRWAAKSLVKKYPEHLTAGVYEGGGAVATVAPGVTALDYLEKIFQIPFWLPPMEEDASRNMMAEMLPRNAEADAKESSGGAAAEAVLSAQEAPPQQPAVTDIVAADQSANSNAQSMVIEAEERNFILQLAGAVGKSPRRLKRFVNTYRILKASLDKLQQETFVVSGGAKGEYKAAMVLLAIVTAAPRSSLGMLNFLANCHDTAPVDDFVAHINVAPDPSESMYALAALQVFQGTEAGVTVKLLRDWAPHVSRFSFRSGSM